MFGIKPKLMKCRFVLTYFYDLLTYLRTIRAKVVIFGIKPKLVKCRFELTYFYDLLTSGHENKDLLSEAINSF
jgi:hypothetical protein